MIGGFQLGTRDEWVTSGIWMIITAILFGALMLYVTRLVSQKFDLGKFTKFLYAVVVLVVLSFCAFIINEILGLYP